VVSEQSANGKENATKRLNKVVRWANLLMQSMRGDSAAGAQFVTLSVPAATALLLMFVGS